MTSGAAGWGNHALEILNNPRYSLNEKDGRQHCERRAVRRDLVLEHAVLEQGHAARLGDPDVPELAQDQGQEVRADGRAVVHALVVATDDASIVQNQCGRRAVEFPVVDVVHQRAEGYVVMGEDSQKRQNAHQGFSDAHNGVGIKDEGEVDEAVRLQVARRAGHCAGLRRLIRQRDGWRLLCDAIDGKDEQAGEHDGDVEGEGAEDGDHLGHQVGHGVSDRLLDVVCEEGGGWRRLGGPGMR